MRAALIATAIYLVIALAAGYVYMQTSSSVALEPLSCGDRNYPVNPEGMILEYRAYITLQAGNTTRTATVDYQVAVTGSPCEASIPVYTPIAKVMGDDTLAALLLNTGLIYPNTLNAPGAVDSRQFIYVLPEEAIMSLRIQAGPAIGPGVGANGRIWPSLTLKQESQSIVGGATLKSLTKASIDPDTGILTELHIASKTPQQEASIDVVLQKVYLPTGAGEYIDQDRLAIAEATPALIAGFALTLSAYTILQASRSEA